jgi:hypothetical protein
MDIERIKPELWACRSCPVVTRAVLNVRGGPAANAWLTYVSLAYPGIECVLRVLEVVCATFQGLFADLDVTTTYIL